MNINKEVNMLNELKNNYECIENKLKKEFESILKEVEVYNYFNIKIEVTNRFIFVFLYPKDYKDILFVNLNAFFFESMLNIGYFEFELTKDFDKNKHIYKIKFEINQLN